MPNIASLLKDEITRISRKAIREETGNLKTAVNAYRAEIAALKRRASTLEQQLKRLQRSGPKPPAPTPEDADASGRRFSAKGLAAHRHRLGLSAQDFGALIGASALSVYKWEKGEVRPRARYLEAIAAIRSIGKKEAAARIAQAQA